LKTWKLYIITLLLLVVVLFLFGFADYQQKQMKLEDIEIVFEEKQPLYLTETIVNKMLIQSESDLLSKTKSKINLHRLEQSLKKNKMTENAEVFYSPSGKLQVNITQRVPVLRISKKSGSYYIDRKGLPMPLSNQYAARVPLVTGLLNDQNNEECYRLIQKINNDTFYQKQIIGIHRRKDGDYILNTRIGQQKIIFGKIENIDTKLKKLKVFYKKEWQSETLKKYKFINLKYKKQVVCSS